MSAFERLAAIRQVDFCRSAPNVRCSQKRTLRVASATICRALLRYSLSNGIHYSVVYFRTVIGVVVLNLLLEKCQKLHALESSINHTTVIRRS